MTGIAHTYAASNPITKVFDTMQGSVLTPILDGILIVIATIAVIFIIKDVISAATSEQGVEQRNHIKAAVIVLVACMLLGFLPSLINWFISLGGTGISGVTFGGK